MSPQQNDVAGPIRQAFPGNPLCLGRDDEIRQLVKLINLKGAPSVCINGGPGIGKTTLSLAGLHATRTATRFNDRRYFVRCDECNSVESLISKLAVNIGVEIAPELESRVFNKLAKLDQVLLVLDNLETPWERDAMRVEEFLSKLSGLPKLTLVVTVRANDRPGGVVWEDPLTLTPVPLSDARDIFCKIGGENFRQDNLLDTLLQAVDLLPLGITLLAHRSEGLSSLSDIHHQWETERSKFLQRADGKHRISNLSLSFELSIHGPRVDDRSRELLYSIAMLPGGMLRETVRSLFPDHSVNELIRVGLAAEENRRVRLLAPLREYVSETYAPPSEAREAILLHYATIAKDEGPKVGTADGKIAVEQITADFENIEFCIREGLATDG